MEGRWVLVGLAAAFVFAGAGCGGDDEAGQTGASATSSGKTIEIHESEFKLDPADVKVDGAGTYTFKAVNDGTFDHALEIEGNGVSEETERIGAGASAEFTVQLKDGTYELYCPVGNHKAQGMVGKVVVGAGGGGTSTTKTNEDNSSRGYGYG